jgi:lysine decarboxylase
MLTTTSTSYILLASLDVARKRLATEGKELAEYAIDLAETARKRINEIGYIRCIGREILGTKATYDMDPTKLIISIKELGISGYDAEKWLRERFNIEVELSDLYNLLCIITPGDTIENINTLIEALTELVKECKDNVQSSEDISVLLPDIPVLSLTPRDAFYAETEVVPFEESAGRITAEFIMIYPPGIPVFIPGEIIMEENLQYIKKNLEEGLPVQGPEDHTLKTLRVIKEHKAIK